MKALIPYVQDDGNLEYLARHGEVVDAVPVVKMGGLSPAFYHADDDDEPDAYLIPVPEEHHANDPT